MINIKPSYVAGLIALRKRLASEQLQRNLARIEAIHAASLRDGAALVIQAAPDKQKPPGLAGPEGFTTRKTLLEVPGGRSPKSA